MSALDQVGGTKSIKYGGLFRGVVVGVDDSQLRARYRVHVHQVHRPTLTFKELWRKYRAYTLAIDSGATPPYPWIHIPWAELMVQPAGKLHGDVPHYDIGDPVWVMFESYSPNQPVIVGGWLSKSYGIHDLSPEQLVDYPSTRKRWQRLDRVGNLIEMSEVPEESWVRLVSGHASVRVSLLDNSVRISTLPLSAPHTLETGGIVDFRTAQFSVRSMQARITGGDVLIQAASMPDAEGSLLALYSQWTTEVYGGVLVFVGQYIDGSDATDTVWGDEDAYEEGAVVEYPAQSTRFFRAVGASSAHTPPTAADANPFSNEYWKSPAYAARQTPLVRVWPERLYLGIVPEEFDRYADCESTGGPAGYNTGAPDQYVPASKLIKTFKAAASRMLIRSPGARMHYKDEWNQIQVWSHEHKDGPSVLDERLYDEAGNTKWRATRCTPYELLPEEGEIVVWADKNLILGSDRDVRVLNHFSFVGKIIASTEMSEGVGEDEVKVWKYTIQRQFKQLEGGFTPVAPKTLWGSVPADDDEFDTEELEVEAYNIQDVGLEGLPAALPDDMFVRVWHALFVDADSVEDPTEPGDAYEEWWFDPGSKSVVYWMKVDGEPGAQTLKKVDPTDPTIVTTLDVVDIVDVYDAMSGDNLQDAEFPDGTHFILFQDSGGAYFVMPYALWRPRS